MQHNRRFVLDLSDSRILVHLIENSRIAMSDLARMVGMSAPSVGERVRRLEAAGVIRGFTVDLDPRAMGYGLEAIVRIRPRPGRLQSVERMIQDEPRFVSCDRVTGEDGLVARLCLRSIEELDQLLDPFQEQAETNAAIVKSSPVRRRTPLPPT